MDILTLVKYILLPILLTYLAYNERDKMAMKQKLNKTLDKQDISDLIDRDAKEQAAEIRALHRQQQNMETKIDKIVTILLERGGKSD